VTETVTGAVAKRETGPSAIIRQYSADFTSVMPGQINQTAWIRLAQGVLRRDKNLAAIAQRNPGSLMQALMECARLGHEPGTEAFYLVPMGNEIEGWEGYRGVIQRMYRAGAVLAVHVQLVKENDRFRYQPGMVIPEHEVDWFGDRGATIGAYSYAEMAGGTTSHVVVINREYIAKVRSMSKGSDKPTSPWVKWEDAMILKTAVHRLEPFVPTSSEDMRDKYGAAARPEAVGIGVEHRIEKAAPVDVSQMQEMPEPNDPSEPVDAEVVE